MIALLADIPGIDSIEQVGFWGALFSAIIYGGYRAWDMIKGSRSRKKSAAEANGEGPPQLDPAVARTGDVYMQVGANREAIKHVSGKVDAMAVDMTEMKEHAIETRRHMEQEEVDRLEVKEFMTRIDEWMRTKQE